ncbi:hypothetical protein FHW12_003759 [Dokdonella fugitiva]|uniref:Uncharacterized protein n=1 Tax=Dokdonella fugitiva TaxID=328517 RepID=A0A839F387_9GAMM|nr:hypothetical protein [Dokdonella fugitiva]MBA8889513.1 hypothetical protein [Dokdonella fugitiva]
MIKKNKKKLVTAAATLLLATSAHAMRLDAGGHGQALWFPYYTVNGGHDTYFTLASTSKVGTVAKVRFLDALHGRPVLDLDVYLAPYDTWTAAIYQTSPDTAPMLRTADRSCTVPAIPAEGVRFTTSGYDGTGTLPANAPQGIGRTREGAIEVIAGGSITDGSPTAIAITPATPGAAPPGCANLPGSLASDIGVAYNDLSGSAAVIDVAGGEYYAYNADAIADFTDVALMPASGPLLPSLAQASKTAYYFSESSGSSNGGAPQTATLPTGIDAVTVLFLSDTVANDYLVDPGLGATTDWIVSYPTRRFYLDPAYANLVAGSVGATVTNGSFDVDLFDREGAGVQPAPQSLRTSVSLPNDAVNVLTIAHGADDASLLDSQFATRLLVGPDAGLLRLRTAFPGFTGPWMMVGDARRMFGSAVSGFMAYNIVNADALPGRLSNYGATFNHRLTKCDGPMPLPESSCHRWAEQPQQP